MLSLFFQGLKWSMGMPLYPAFLGCSRNMELWLITSVWTASCTALCANAHAFWKGFYSFMLVQQKAITPHMREYTSAAENSKHHTSICIVCIAYSLMLYYMGGVELASVLLEGMGRACDPLPAVNRCYLSTSASIVRSLDWNATLSCFIYLCFGFQFVNSLNW